jgi:hypothetical protein
MSMTILGEYLINKIKQAPNSENKNVWVALTAILQKLPQTQGGGKQLFDQPMDEVLEYSITKKFNKILESSRVLRLGPGNMDLIFTFEDMYFDLYNKWLESRHDKYYAYETFLEFLSDTSTDSYLAKYKLIPRYIINEVIKRIGEVPPGLQIIQEAIIHDGKLYSNFEFRMKDSTKVMNYYAGGAHNITPCNPDQTIQTKTGTKLNVTIDQESEDQHITTFISGSSSLEPASLMEQLQDPGYEIVKHRSSYQVLLSILNNLNLESPLFYDRPKITIKYKNKDGSITELYSVQVEVVSNLTKESLTKSNILVYRIRLPLRTNLNNNNRSKIIEIPTGISGNAAKEGGATQKLGKLLGDRQQALSVLYHLYYGDQSLILATGDTSLLNEYNHLFNVMKKSLPVNRSNYSRKLAFSCIFDTSTAVVGNSNISKRKGADVPVYVFGNPALFKVVNKKIFGFNVRTLYSKRTQVEKNLRVNIFKTNNNSYKTKNSYVGKANNIVPRIREAMYTIKQNRAGTNNNRKLNNIKKSNCNANGNPLNAPRRYAQKMIVKELIRVARNVLSENRKPESKNYENAIINYLRRYEISGPIELTSNQRRLLCSSNNLNRLRTRQNVRGNNFRSHTNVTSGSHEGVAVGNSTNGVESRPPPKRISKPGNSLSKPLPNGPPNRTAARKPGGKSAARKPRGGGSSRKPRGGGSTSRNKGNNMNSRP